MVTENEEEEEGAAVSAGKKMQQQQQLHHEALKSVKALAARTQQLATVLLGVFVVYWCDFDVMLNCSFLC